MKKIGAILYPIGYQIGKAVGFDMFTPEEVKAMEVEGANADVPNFWTGTIYGVSLTHVVVGLVLGVLLAVPLGLVKPKIRYRRARRTAKRSRK